MNRIIKFRFRLKNFDGKITTHIYTLEQLMKHAIGYPNHIISQDEFTNLLDKNGKEIYEGDIIKHEQWDNDFTTIVKWNTDMAKFDIYWIKDNQPSLTSRLADREYEIIGNTYSKPELLTKL